MTTPAIMLALLVTPWVAVRLVAVSLEARRFAGVLGVTLVFCFTGVGHFVVSESMAAMLPPALPWRLAGVYVSGVVEIVLACLLMVPRLRRTIGWCLIVVLVGLLPINIYAAVEQVPMGGHAWGPVYLLVRVPLQVVLIAWVYWFAARPQRAMNDNLLFVYGTLLENIPGEMASLMRENTTKIGHGSVQGRLFDLGKYPGAVDSDDAHARVRGVVYRLREADAVLSRLDTYEECGPGDSEPHEYRRVRREVTLDNGSRTNTWVYLYNGPTDKLSCIESGDYADIRRDAGLSRV